MRKITRWFEPGDIVVLIAVTVAAVLVFGCGTSKAEPTCDEKGCVSPAVFTNGLTLLPPSARSSVIECPTDADWTDFCVDGRCCGKAAIIDGRWQVRDCPRLEALMGDP